MEYLLFYFMIGCVLWLYSPTGQGDFIDGIKMFFHCTVLWGFWLVFIIFLLIFDRR